MAVLCPEYDLLFIGNTRTGSTAISKTLIGLYNGRFLPRKPFTLDGRRVSKKHSTLRQLLDHRLLDEDPARLLKFTAVRNPFDSAVSLYIKQRYRANRADTACQQEGMSFSEFIRHRFGRRRPYSMHAKYVDGMDEVIRFENLQEGLRDVLVRARAPIHEILVKNRTEEKTRHYSEYYDDESREIVGRVFAEDLERFGYSFDEG